MMTDPISDMLTRIRNAVNAKQKFVIVPFSKFKMEILDVIKKAGYIDNIEVKEVGNGFGNIIRIKLKYSDSGKSIISGLKKVSKPGRRIYVSKDNLPVVLGGLGIAVVSTSQGVMTNIDAKKKNLGGEVICEIY
ncbi:MAG TPA: 30S ribosomal protein S8 [bacterium]|nr:30S ribosomal protein S8 [Patescibacteria group bacterium]HOC96185.1 30S ribosomal protein S8 [bacterium]HPO11143.1 30S ribosomal protein S8 [bacterium]HPV55136.1 30S ribosomal protein S8 [Bacilli bacterium]